MTRSSTRRWTRAAALALTVGVAVVLTPSVGQAAPATAGEARQAVADTAQKLSALDEQVHEATAAAEQQEAAAAAAAGAAAQAQAQLDALEPQLRAIAQTGYVGTTRGRLAAFLTSGSADDLIQQMNTLDQLASHADGIVAAAAAARTAAEQAQQQAAAAAATAAEAEAALQAQKDQLQDELAGYQSDFARLSAVDQVRVLNVVSGPDVVAAPAAAPSEAAGIAVETALAQVGDMYGIGASGPDSFDCSGLTQYAYAAAGVSLPHSSRAQSTMGVPVSRAELQPGDLVFFYSPISHVGMYIGNGQMVHASVSGKPVAVTSVDKGGYVSARRVTGG
ncbi:C40 family peptidase [Modestobacter versicolor]|uniref:Cell wall-associated NlpC family hydrolase n=1 Tax=Modestobacter versicolor TaxID=429133 RepID=A0A323V7V3_9ACTN|nr:C40 family peptidase [Modestobacter versicolor]MBB3677605.1 cell wall-associated NlpC family hydrolase [Modestobacter versicolor]PZA20100.1 NlpC/P60 family protein [Modestobacter versicolor]